jgi:hypothetical protein
MSKPLLASLYTTGIVVAGLQRHRLWRIKARPKIAPILSHICSVPSQFNYDEDIGPEDDGQRYTLNIQPVVPFSLDEIGTCRTLEILNRAAGRTGQENAFDLCRRSDGNWKLAR